mgnify:CR=1 FL=1
MRINSLKYKFWLCLQLIIIKFNKQNEVCANIIAASIWLNRVLHGKLSGYFKKTSI